MNKYPRVLVVSDYGQLIPSRPEAYAMIGKVVPKGDPEAMAKVLVELFHDREQIKDLSQKALNFIQTEFHINRTVEKLKEYYNEMAVDL